MPERSTGLFTTPLDPASIPEMHNSLSINGERASEENVPTVGFGMSMTDRDSDSGRKIARTLLAISDRLGSAADTNDHSSFDHTDVRHKNAFTNPEPPGECQPNQALAQTEITYNPQSDAGEKAAFALRRQKRGADRFTACAGGLAPRVEQNYYHHQLRLEAHTLE
jgi:hypothetical protein